MLYCTIQSFLRTNHQRRVFHRLIGTDAPGDTDKALAPFGIVSVIDQQVELEAVGKALGIDAQILERNGKIIDPKPVLADNIKLEAFAYSSNIRCVLS